MSSNWFEDFTEGQCWESGYKTISQEMVESFAGLTGDKNPLHLDPNYAAGTIFRSPISHGLLGLSLAAGIVYDLDIIRETVLAFKKLEWNFLKPVYPGDRIRLRLRVNATLPSKRPDRGCVLFAATILNEKQQVAQEGIWTMVIYRKPPADRVHVKKVG